MFTNGVNYTSKACVAVWTRKYESVLLLKYESVLLLQYVHKINNQLLSSANAKDINTDYYITNSTLASRYHRSVA